MKLAVVGSRDFNVYELLKTELNKFRAVDIIVSGGVDKLAERYATEYNIIYLRRSFIRL